MLKAAATSAAEAAAGKTASTATSAEAGAAGRTARGRGEGLRGERGHAVEAVGEIHAAEHGAGRGVIPGRRLLEDAVEGGDPLFLDAEGHGEGEIFFERLLLGHVRGGGHALEA